MSDAISKLIMFIFIFIVCGGVISSSIYNAIKVSMLQKELSAMNQSWHNSNQSTITALETSDFIKRQYAKRFYSALTLIKDPNSKSKCLNTSISDSMKQLLDLPPENIKIDGNITDD